MKRLHLPGLLLLLALGSSALAAAAAPASPEAAVAVPLPRAAPFPAELQGRWVDADDPATELVVAGGELSYAGRVVPYDHKVVSRRDGALAVSLGIDDRSQEDSFQRQSITGLVITPDGELHGYNVKFASRFVRPTGR